MIKQVWEWMDGMGVDVNDKCGDEQRVQDKEFGGLKVAEAERLG